MRGGLDVGLEHDADLRRLDAVDDKPQGLPMNGSVCCSAIGSSARTN
jgi:hypothetical protein